MTCTGIGRMWNSRVGILGCHEEPAGKASVGQTADRPDEGRRDQDLVCRAKIRGQDARIGHRGRRTGSAVRGHNEVKDISARGLRSRRVPWSVLGGSARAGSWKGGRRARGWFPSGCSGPQGPERPRPGAQRSPQTRGCKGAARGFRARIPRRLDPSPLRAPPPGRGPAWPAICFTSTPLPPPGPPGPQECSGGGGRGCAWRGGGRDRRRTSPSASAFRPIRVGAGGSGGRVGMLGA